MFWGLFGIFSLGKISSIAIKMGWILANPRNLKRSELKVLRKPVVLSFVLGVYCWC